MPAEAARKPSLRARVVAHVMLPLMLTWMLGSALTVGIAYFFAEEAFDRALLDDAYAVASRVRVHKGEVTLDLSSGEVSCC